MTTAPVITNGNGSGATLVPTAQLEEILRRLAALEATAVQPVEPQPVKVVMTPEVAARLRAPFAADQIRHKPTIWCPSCSKHPDKCCGQPHRKGSCDKCRQKSITSGHTCVAFVGHAEVEDRLFSVDPNWGWKPLSKDDHGFPLLDAKGNLWIELTVAGKTVLGVGDCAGERITGWKPIIGDAIRNAAYRGFCVAIEQWGAAEKAAEEAEVLAATSEPAQPVAKISKKMLADISALRVDLGVASPASDAAVLKVVSDTVGEPVRALEDLTPRQGAAVIDSMRKRRDRMAAAAKAAAPTGTPEA